MSRHNGTGLHPYWYIRLIALLLTVFLPICLVMYLDNYHPEILIKYMNEWIIFAWVIFMVLVLILSLKIESILEKKKDQKATIITNVNISDEQSRTLNQVFEQIDITFKNNSSYTNPDGKEIVLCPKCHNDNVARTKSGKYICLTCEQIFY